MPRPPTSGHAARLTRRGLAWPAAALAFVYALAEVADWHALRIAVFSACGTLTFGLCGDAEHVSAIDTLAHEIEGEFAALTRQRTTV